MSNMMTAETPQWSMKMQSEKLKELMVIKWIDAYGMDNGYNKYVRIFACILDFSIKRKEYINTWVKVIT